MTCVENTANNSKMIQKVVCVGGGCIGSGWAARFALNGVDVTVLDPTADKIRGRVQEVFENAKNAYEKLIPGHEKLVEGASSSTDSKIANKSYGTITVIAEKQDPESFAKALREAEFIQESLPEVPEIKKACYQVIEEHCQPTTVIGSSTSGILPSLLQADMKHPERLVVAHPFNPVYLLPLVEICPGSKTKEQFPKRAIEVYKSVGMHPLLMQKEIMGFISDRLLEAVWREGLHLVNDGIATADQVDQAICYGPGLRWAFMGSFLTYRLGGGDAGMRHFMSQFGPCLKWPWTKLEAPELTEELLDKIVEQSDEQAAGRSVDDLMKMRDNALVSVLGALKGQGCSAGKTLADYEQKLFKEAGIDEPEAKRRKIDGAGTL